MTRGAMLGVAAVVAGACTPGGGTFTVGEVEFAAPPGSLAPNLALAGDVPVLTWLEPTDGDRYALRVAVRTEGKWQVVGTPVENDSLFVNWADFPSVTALPDGRMVAHWLQKIAPETYAYHVKLAISHDRGRTWGAPFVPHGDLSPTEHGFVAMVPWEDGAGLIWLDGRNTRGLAEGSPPGAMTLRFTTLDADGTPAADVELDGRICDCCQTDLAPTADGLIAVYRDRSEEEIRDIAVVRFADGAWSAPAKVSDDGWYYPGCPVNGPAVVARGNLAVVAWFTGANDTRRVYAAISHDGGASFSERLRIDDGSPTGRTDIVLIDDRTAAVSWIEKLEEGAEIRMRTVDVEGNVGRAHAVATTSAARASGFPRLVAVGGDVVLTWTDPLDRRVRVATVQVVPSGT